MSLSCSRFFVLLLATIMLPVFTVQAQVRTDAADAAGTPGFSWSGNTNTGLFQPATNIVAFSTAGTERARVTSTGVSVTGAVRATNFIGDGSALTNLSGDNLGDHTATTNLGIGSNLLTFGNTVTDKIRLYSNTYGIGIESSTLTNWSGSAFRWRIGGVSSTAGSQQMLLNTTGLTVSGSVLINNDDSFALPGFTWASDSNTGIFNAAADAIGLSTGGAERMRILANGRVGIGEATPSHTVVIANIANGASGETALSLRSQGYAGLHIQANVFTGCGGCPAPFNGGVYTTYRMGPGDVTDGVAFVGQTNKADYSPLDQATALSGSKPRSIILRGQTSSPNYGGVQIYDGDTQRMDFRSGIATLYGDLTTTGNISLNTGGYIYGDKNDNSYTSGLYLYSADSANTGAYISLYGVDHATAGGRIAYIAVSDTAGALLHRFYSRNTAGTASTLFSLYQGGNATLVGEMTAASYSAASNVDAGTNVRVMGAPDDVGAPSTNFWDGMMQVVETNATSNWNTATIYDSNEMQTVSQTAAGTAVASSYNINAYGGTVTVGSSSYGANFVVRGTGTTCTIGNGTGATACTSDRRLKQDIHPLDNSLEKITALQGVNFRWKKDPSANRIGLIAQDVEKQFPEVVETDPETGMKSVAYPSLVAPLIESVKQLKTENATLKQNMADMQKDIAILKAALKAK